jgi:hypothetical protein
MTALEASGLEAPAAARRRAPSARKGVGGEGTALTEGKGSAGMGRAKQPQARLSRPPRAVALGVFSLICALAIVAGWRIRGELLVSAEEPLGYWLGVAGLAMMLLLLLYSVRKRLRLLRTWGPVWPWFHIHMILGIVGPTLILFHANFRLGSLNSNVAMSCMILVAASGIIGRFIYTRIHHGLLGRQTTLDELKDEENAGRQAVREAISAAPELAYHFQKYEKFALGSSWGPIAGLSRLLMSRPYGWLVRRRALRGLKRVLNRPVPRPEGSPVPDLRAARRAIGAYLEAVHRVAQLSVYERLFAAWHVIHLPLTIMLFISAALHVVAVHMY